MTQLNNSSENYDEEPLSLSDILSTENNIPTENAFYLDPEAAITELQEELLNNVGGGTNQQGVTLQEMFNKSMTGSTEVSDDQVDAVKKSEMEAALPSNLGDHTRVVATGEKKLLTYEGEGENRKAHTVTIAYEARNVNFFSTPIDQMREDERKTIRTRVAQNIHYEEECLGSKDIRTIIKDGSNKIEVKAEIPKGEQYKRFKFHKKNLIADNGAPYAVFFINDEPIYTYDLEAAGNRMLLRIGEADDSTKKDPSEQLCQAIKSKSGIDVKPEEIMGYLESGFLINTPEISD